MALHKHVKRLANGIALIVPPVTVLFVALELHPVYTVIAILMSWTVAVIYGAGYALELHRKERE